MTANTASRETVRDAFASLLSSALIGVGKPVQAVYNYPIGVITETPVVCIGSGGTARQRAGIGDTRFNSYFQIDVYIWVKDADAANNWTEADVEDKLDAIEKAISDVVADNRANANWTNIMFGVDDNGVPEFSSIVTDTERGYKLEYLKVYIQRIDQ